jgi:hypothetical protein
MDMGKCTSCILYIKQNPTTYKETTSFAFLLESSTTNQYIPNNIIYPPVGGSERQVDKEIVGCDDGVTKEKGLISGSERQVNQETERSDIGGTRGEGLVCGIEKQDDRMTERCS